MTMLKNVAIANQLTTGDCSWLDTCHIDRPSPGHASAASNAPLMPAQLSLSLYR